MKLVIVSNFFSNDKGGAIRIAYNQAIEFKKMGHDVHVFTSEERNGLGWLEQEGIKIFTIKAKEMRYITRSYLGLFNTRIHKEFKRFLKQVDPDIVHFHDLYYQLPFSLIKIAGKSKAKVFFTIHNVMVLKYEKLIPKVEDYIFKIGFKDQIKEAGKTYNPFRNVIIRHYLKYADKIFAVSDSFKKLLNINRIRNVETIHNGINVEEWQISKSEIDRFKKKYNLINKKVIFFGGRLWKAKGGDQILRAIALAKEEEKNIILLVGAQKNKYIEEMQKLVDKLGIKKNVIFTGWLKGDQLIAAYHSANIYLFPSICFETFGMANLEAMACKKPVISSYFGGPGEVIVNNKTGYLINPNNIESIAEKIIDLLKNSEKAKKFGQAGYQRVKEYFSLEKQINTIFKFYKQFLRNEKNI